MSNWVLLVSRDCSCLGDMLVHFLGVIFPSLKVTLICGFAKTTIFGSLLALIAQQSCKLKLVGLNPEISWFKPIRMGLLCSIWSKMS